MCGVSFYLSNVSKLSELQNSLSLTMHRGPDSSGIYNYKYDDYFVGLGHNRLSIIDLTESGIQPMVRDDVVISFNGEIYNYIQLRNELQNRGYVFTTGTDTEVIINLFKCFGTEAFSKLKGMFCFVILDMTNNAIYMVRDTVGIKPLYYYQNDISFFACSEIKGLKAFNEVVFNVSRDDVFEFLNNGFLYEPSTGFDNIKKVLPGHYIHFDLNSSKTETVKYSTLISHLNDSTLEEIVKNSINRQLIADVPVGIFFSGGTDSTILASLAGESELLFAKYEKDFSSDIDLKYSKMISDFLNKPLTVTELSNSSDVDSILSSFDFVARNTEELISDFTFWSTYLLSKSAHSSGYTVMLSGMGGDEAFCGYPRYTILKYHSLIKNLSFLFKIMFKFNIYPKSLSKKIERLISYCNENEWALSYTRLIGYFSSHELRSFFDDFDILNQRYLDKLSRISQDYSGSKDDKVKLAQHYDLTGFLAHNLTVSDKASMLASIELRVPLLDESVLAHGLSLKSEDLIRGKILKYPLKKLLRSIIPQKLIERPKTGFNPPLDNLILILGEANIIQELSYISDFLRTDVVDSIVKEHFSGKINNTYKIWQLIYFSRWLKVHTS